MDAGGVKVPAGAGRCCRTSEGGAVGNALRGKNQGEGCRSRGEGDGVGAVEAAVGGNAIHRGTGVSGEVADSQTGYRFGEGDGVLVLLRVGKVTDGGDIFKGRYARRGGVPRLRGAPHDDENLLRVPRYLAQPDHHQPSHTLFPL